MTPTLDEALGFRRRILEATASARRAVTEGTTFIGNLRAEIGEIAVIVRELGSTPVDLIDGVTRDLANRMEHLINGNLESVGSAASEMEHRMECIVTELPCEEGVRNFAGDSPHDECYHVDDVILTVHDGKAEIRDAGYVRQSDLGNWFEHVADQGRLADIIDEAAREAHQDSFDVEERPET